MKIAIKNKAEMKYIDSDKLQVGDITLKELYNVVNEQNEIIVELIQYINDSHLVKKDTAYIIKVGNRLEQIDNLELVAVEDLKYPLRFYTIDNGKIKLDKKKVVAI